MQYTLVITSSGRHHLLKQTIEMFLATADQQPREIIVIEDGPEEMPPWFPRNAKWLTNGVRRGQIYSVDKAYEQVKTDYIFHCEDDWGFYESGYIKESLDVLEKYPDILQVWLRGIPTAADLRDRFTIYRCEPHPTHPVTIANYIWGDWRGGFSFNPGLRRLSDYRRIGSYGRHVGYDPKGCGERSLGLLFDRLGYTAAILPKPYVYHIGEEAHVDRSLNHDLPRILIAVPTAEVLDYSEFRRIQERVYGRVWTNGISGLQIDGPNLRRAAVEATWAKDVANFKNTTLKFFTGTDLGCRDDFVSMPSKIKAMCNWALENGFNRMLRVDDDSFVYVDRAIRQACDFPVDYAGWDCGGFGIGGSGVWLSRRAMEIVAQGSWAEGEWRDDAYIGHVLKEHGIKMTDLPGLGQPGECPPGWPIVLHPVSPVQMIARYNEWSHPSSTSSVPV